MFDSKITPKPDANVKGSESSNALADFLTGGKDGQTDGNVLGSFAKGGSEALQSTLSPEAKDFAQRTLEQSGTIPQREQVADLSQATATDTSAPIQSMMADDAMDSALKNT